METSFQSNLNANEIAKFDAMAQHWWDPNGPCAPLHLLNPLRMAWIREHAANLDQKAVLDVGCGGGLLTEGLAPHSLQITGIDGSEKAIQVAKKHALAYQHNIDYYQTTAEEFSEKYPQHYDVICCLELIEHVPCPQSLIQALARLVKPSGSIFISTLNRTPKSYLSAIIGAEYLLKMLPKGTHDYQSFIRPSELVTMGRKVNLKLEALQGVRYHPFKQQFTLSDDVAVNYLTCFRLEL